MEVSTIAGLPFFFFFFDEKLPAGLFLGNLFFNLKNLTVVILEIFYRNNVVYSNSKKE